MKWLINNQLEQQRNSYGKEHMKINGKKAQRTIKQRKKKEDKYCAQPLKYWQKLSAQDNGDLWLRPIQPTKKRIDKTRNIGQKDMTQKKSYTQI